MNDNQNCFNIKLAGVTIQVDAPTPRTMFHCLKYLTTETPDVYVSVKKEDVKREIQKCEAAGLVNKDKVYNYNDHLTVYINEINEPFLETMTVYYKIAEALCPYNIILMHGAVVANGENAFMFTANSGVGKTTHIKKWIENVPTVTVVNGDKPLIKVSETSVIACGTPWCGKECMGENIMVPLKAVVIMERSEINQMEEISFSEAYPYLLQQTYISSDVQTAECTLSIIAQLYKKVRFYRFHFNNFKDDCFTVSYNTLTANLK